MKPLILFVLGPALLVQGCSAPREVNPSAALSAESPNAWRSPVLPQLAGVRVSIGNSWLDLFEPPTIEQAALQAGATFQVTLDEAKSIEVRRADGQIFKVRPGSYADFMLKNGDMLYVTRRIAP